ncbi:MAG: hypothetical protein H6740_25795 [Alphaproteobacteria bacterium]|nr:hypothetical protein [Alphaproteobacteria bacterium]
MRAVLVLMQPPPGAQRATSRQPLGRAALALAAEGIEVRVGTAQAAWRARGERWERCELDDTWAIHDRFQGGSSAPGYAEALRGLEALPLANPSSLRRLCRDKLATQARLEAAGLPMPEVEADPARFERRLSEWGAAFFKPRDGAKGEGVRHVRPGDALPASWEGGPCLLQRAVPPPAGFVGLSLRWLIQAELDRGWRLSPPVARICDDDPVANVDRGARAAPGEDLLPARALDAGRALCEAAAEALSAGLSPVVELAVDLVFDPDWRPFVIEVNSRPGGRVRALAELDPARFEAAQDAANARPLRWLAAKARA